MTAYFASIVIRSVVLILMESILSLLSLTTYHNLVQKVNKWLLLRIVPHGFSPKQLMDIVRKMSVSNKGTICLDKSEDGSNDMCLKSFKLGLELLDYHV